MLSAPGAPDTLQGPLTTLRHILTRADNNATSSLPKSPQVTHVAKPGTPSPPISGCSDVSTPDRFSLRQRQQQQQQQQAAEVHTPCSKRTPLQHPLGTSHADASFAPQVFAPQAADTKRAQSFSPADLDAAAAMLELPSAYNDGSNGGASGSNGGSSHSSDGGSAEHPTAADGTGAEQKQHRQDPFATDMHASIADASAESAAELLLAAGRLASVSSQTSRTDNFLNSLARMPTYSLAPSAAAAAAAVLPTVEDSETEAAAGASTRAYYHSSAGGSAGYAAGPAAAAAAAAAAAGSPTMMSYAPGFYDNSMAAMGQSSAAAAAAAAATAAMYSMANRPVGCSCLKPCKPHTPCQQCGSPHSPGHTWRAGPAGPGTLCNACGTRYSRSKQKQMAAAAAAAAAAAGGSGEMLWSGSNGGSSAYTDGLAGSSGVGKSMKGKQSKVSKAASSRVVKGAGGKGNRTGAGTPYGVLAALERRWAQSGNAYGASAEAGMGHSGGGVQGLEGQGSFSEEQQQWVLQWHAVQQQYEQQYSQEAGQMATEQVEQQQWLMYSQWMQQQQQQQQE